MRTFAGHCKEECPQRMVPVPGATGQVKACDFLRSITGQRHIKQVSAEDMKMKHTLLVTRNSTPGPMLFSVQQETFILCFKKTAPDSDHLLVWLVVVGGKQKAAQFRATVDILDSYRHRTSGPVLLLGVDHCNELGTEDAKTALCHYTGPRNAFLARSATANAHLPMAIEVQVTRAN